jgi:hypothetical protein
MCQNDIVEILKFLMPVMSRILHYLNEKQLRGSMPHGLLDYRQGQQ